MMRQRGGGGGGAGGGRGGGAVGGEVEDNGKGRHTGRCKNDNDNYAPHHLELEAALALSDLEPVILFAFRGE